MFIFLFLRWFFTHADQFSSKSIFIWNKSIDFLIFLIARSTRREHTNLLIFFYLCRLAWMDKTQLRFATKPCIIYTLSAMSLGRLDSRETRLSDNQAPGSPVIQKQDIEMKICATEFIHDDFFFKTRLKTSNDNDF